MDIIKITEKGLKMYNDFKKNGELGFCCLSDEALIILNMILQMAKQEGVKLKIKLIRDKKE